MPHTSSVPGMSIVLEDPDTVQTLVDRLLRSSNPVAGIAEWAQVGAYFLERMRHLRDVASIPHDRADDPDTLTVSDVVATVTILRTLGLGLDATLAAAGRMAEAEPASVAFAATVALPSQHPVATECLAWLDDGDDDAEEVDA